MLNVLRGVVERFNKYESKLVHLQELEEELKKGRWEREEMMVMIKSLIEQNKNNNQSSIAQSSSSIEGTSKTINSKPWPIVNKNAFKALKDTWMPEIHVEFIKQHQEVKDIKHMLKGLIEDVKEVKDIKNMLKGFIEDLQE